MYLFIYLLEKSLSEPSITGKWLNKVKYLIRNSARFEFGKKTRSIKIPSNSIRCNYQKIYSLMENSETLLEIRKKSSYLEVINKPIIYIYIRNITNNRKKTNKALLFAIGLFSAFLDTMTRDETFQQSWKQDSLIQSLETEKL